ncbi:MAG: efflux RND transporter periplasmic adaptor subunit [Bacteroidetes bacterium]|nr:efflux RND transporter periplasmic adaptor subunit [Bacteroidota bacterium]
MKYIHKILFVVVGLAVGVGLGYLFFADSAGSMPDSGHVHEGTEDETIWTCSMHPQIRREEPGLCPICEMDLIPMDQTVSDDPLALQMSSEAIKLANVQTTLVRAGGGSDSRLSLSGKVQKDERLASSLVSHIPGRIEKLFVTFEGEQVRKGQQVATIFSEELIAAQRDFLEALKFKDVNPGMVEAVKNKLGYWKLPTDFLEKLETSGKVQETFTLYAEVAGVVTERLVSTGDYVNAGKPLFKLVDLSRVWILFDAYEEDLSKVSIGQKVYFTSPAVPGKTYASKIAFIDPVIDPVKRVAHLRAEAANPSGLLKPEMLVKGVLEGDSRLPVSLLVPKSAVLWTGERSVVYVELPEREVPTYEYREIDLGKDLGESYEVLAGLEAGERVVSNGAFMVDAAAQLNNQQSMINRMLDVAEATEASIPDFQDQVDIAFQRKLEDLADTYLKLKDQLVLTDPQASAKASMVFSNRLESLEPNAPDKELQNWWKETRSAMLQHAAQLGASDDVEVQRKQFQFLSSLIIQSIQAFGLVDDTLYVQHCPMAFDDQGADWLAAEEEINNPYFGDKMLRCGLVEATLIPGAK